MVVRNGISGRILECHADAFDRTPSTVIAQKKSTSDAEAGQNGTAR